MPENDQGTNFHAVKSHVGGLAWVGDMLCVADTDAIRLFDLRHIWRAEPAG